MDWQRFALQTDQPTGATVCRIALAQLKMRKEEKKTRKKARKITSRKKTKKQTKKKRKGERWK